MVGIIRVSVYIKSLTDRHVIADFSMNSYLGGLRVRTENDGRKIKKISHFAAINLVN